MPDPTLKEHPHKRRRLSPGLLHGLHVTTTPLPHPDPLPKVNKLVSCSSCHRLLNGKSGQSVSCARCNAATCTVCSRTCSSAPPSYPPTPVLSHSPTPPTTPSASPRRVALSHSNTNAAVTRRRKFQDDEEDEAIAKEKHDAEGWTPGCGRVVCRSCCVEIPQSDSTTCYDCYRAPTSVVPV
ncbi:hypothetical protein DENSPDRAFT_859839 [Dentipellis sp. KUC8613]|nr:hypothetical protein DENSPDRAFT_859839 [Dentipellis sp. KUC8613]